MCEDPYEQKFTEEHLIEGPVTYDFTLHLRACYHTTCFWRCLGTAFGNFILVSHNFMSMALGLCEVTLSCMVGSIDLITKQQFGIN